MNKSLSYLEQHLKEVIIVFVAIFIYFLYSSFEAAVLDIFNINYDKLSTFLKVSYLIVGGIIEVIILGLLFNKQLKEAYKDIKVNHKKYFDTYFKYWFVILITMILSNTLINSILGEVTTSANESSIRELIVSNPVYAYFSTVFVAPFIEEIIFRQGFRILFKNNILFILMSGLIFGGLHVVTSLTSWVDLLYLIPYCVPGVIFAYIMSKTNNVLVSMFMHFFHNGVLVSLEMFVLLFLS